MSRALDKDVVASLRNGDHTYIYQDISQTLARHAGPGLLEIEILGRGHPIDPGQSFLQEGNAVGIPKLRLVQAFVVARQLFVAKKSGKDELRSATAVLLLMDAEHLTAANTRKRLLLQDLEAYGSAANDLLDREKSFVDSLLTSRLHRHTKSPTLWSHRRWLIEQYRRAGHSLDLLRDIEEVVMVSGERHPRNYYAWCHARWLTRVCEKSMSQGDRQILFGKTKKWCFSHHHDVSGWSFLEHLTERGLTGGYDDAALLVFRETLRLTKSFQWRNESVWWYLRTAAAKMRLPVTDEEEFRSVYQKLAETADEASNDRRVLSAAWEWRDKHRDLSA